MSPSDAMQSPRSSILLFSLYGRLALPFTRVLHFDGAVPAMRIVAHVAPQQRATPKRNRASLAPSVHALLVDASGAWSWESGDCHAAATRHASVHDWMEEHPGCDVRLWVAGELLRSLGDASSAHMADDGELRSQARRTLVERHGERATQWALATWRSELAGGVCALAGIDFEALTRHAQRHGVRMRSVVPWWYHAFLEARRCVVSLVEANDANVCIVEGQQIAWLTTAAGQLIDVQQGALESPCIAALGDEIRTIAARTGGAQNLTVVLGQGLADGARTQALNALVLGRLDGEQPPQWLRPSLRKEMH